MRRSSQTPAGQLLHVDAAMATQSATGFALESAIIIAIAFFVCLSCCFVAGKLGQSPKEGYREYITAGTRLALHGTITSPLILDDAKAEASALMPPVYVAVVAVAYKVFGEESDAATLALQLLNMLAVAMTAWLAWLIACRAGGRKAGRITATICILNPAIFGYAGYIWDTCLFSMAVVVTVWIVQRMALSDAGVGRFALLGIWLGLIAHLNPALTAAYPLLVLYPLLNRSSRQWTLIAKCVCASVMGWLIAIAPWTIRNHSAIDRFVYVRGGFGLELWLGVCPEADGDGQSVYRSQFPLNNSDIQDEISATGEEAFIADRGHKAIGAVWAMPARFVRLVAVRAIDYWTGLTASHSGWHGIVPRSTERRVVMVFLSAELLVLVASLLVRGRPNGFATWLIAVIVVFSIVYCLTHVQVRFRTPTEPLLAVVIATTLFGPSKMLRASKLRASP